MAVAAIAGAVITDAVAATVTVRLASCTCLVCVYEPPLRGARAGERRLMVMPTDEYSTEFACFWRRAACLWSDLARRGSHSTGRAAFAKGVCTGKWKRVAKWRTREWPL